MSIRRSKGISIKVTDDEYAAVARLAAGRAVSSWVHELVLASATPRPVDHVLLAEFIALRTIVLNLQVASAAGETPKNDVVKRLIQHADETKIGRAREHLMAMLPRRTP